MSELQQLWEEQKRILGEPVENIGILLTEEQLLQKRKMLFNLRKEYLGEDKPVNKITPLVSVCVPTYQHKDFIEDCLKGALMQKTDFLYEIIVCDDGSIDGTVEICRQYAEKYPDKIRLYDHNRSMTRLFDNNGNVKAYLNWWWALDSARGKYIALCEGDDYWTDPLKLQKQVDFLEANPEFILCFTNAAKKKENVIVQEKIITIYTKTIYRHKDMPIHAPTLTRLFRNLHLDTYPINDAPGGDTFLLVYQSKFGKVKFMDIVTACYREHNGGVWSSLDKNDKLKHQFYTRYACLSIAEKPLYAKLVLILYFIMLSIDNSTEYVKMQNMMKSVHTFGLLKMIRTIFYMLKK